MNSLFNHPAFGIALTILLYSLGIHLHAKLRHNPFLKFLIPLSIAVSLGILLLKVTGIPLEAFNQGGEILNFFLGPIVVILALPIYRSRALILEHARPILGAVISASFVSISSVVWLSRLLNLDEPILRSLLGKSTTTPIALELSRMTGGNGSLAVLGVILTGIFGAMAGETLFDLLKIRHPIAKGLALGSVSHAVGTSAAFALGETEGSLASLAMGISGIVSVLWLPLLMALYNL